MKDNEKIVPNETADSGAADHNESVSEQTSAPTFTPEADIPKFDPYTGLPLSGVQMDEEVSDNVQEPVDEQIEEKYTYNPVPVAAPVDYSSAEQGCNSGKGLRIFALILALTVALSACVGLGYFMGRSSLGGSTGENTKVNKVIELEETPVDKDAMSAAAVYEEVNPSVVGIMVYNMAGAAGSASGVIFTDDGYIITNDHIYSGIASPKFIIYTHDGTEYTAEYVGGDNRSDIAVLKITDLDTKLKPATFGSSDELQIGQKVAAVGRPMDATHSSNITEGIVSLIDARVTVSSNYANKVIQTDTAINPGSSGGALVNMFGQIVGITSAKIVGSEYEGIGYAITTTTVKKVAESLIQYGKVVNRAKLGITYQEINSVTAAMGGYDATGLYVADVTNSDLTGVLEEGDIIVAINGKEILNADLVLDVIENALPGDTITLGVLKDGEDAVQTVTAKLLSDEGSSSLDTSVPTEDSNNSSYNNGSSFTFPFGD